MQITCPSCNAEYNVDASRIPADGMTMRCPKCSHGFRVAVDGSTRSEAAGGGTMLDGAGAALNERYYVKRSTGKVFGPFDGSAVEMMLKSGKLSAAAEASIDKVAWKPISSIPAFSKYATGEAHITSADPKSTMMGGWQKQSPSAQPGDLPASKDGGELPASKDGIGLPTPKATPGLPMSKPTGAPGLPVSKSAGAPGLPVPKSGPPALPVMKAAPGLPVPKGAPGLPVPKAAPGLPTPKGAPGLPVPKGAPGLPVPTAAPGLPVPSGTPGLPTGGLAGGTNATMQGGLEADSDLFGAPPADDGDLFGAPASNDEDDDLFGSPGGGDDDDLFGSPSNDDDLFGGGGNDDDDMFASPDRPAGNDDDIFGPAGGAAPAVDEDDLFGTSDDGGDDDLFIERDHRDDQDDFLGGDGGFSFLDDAPPPEEDDGWGDDLFDDGPAPEPEPVVADSNTDDWGEELLDRPKPRPKVQEQVFDNSDPFRPMSSGIREVEEEPEEQETVSEQVDDKKRGNMMLIIVPVLVVLLGGVGYGLYSAFFAEDGPVVKTGPKVVKTGPVGVDFALVQPDNHSDYINLIDKAMQGKVSDADASKLLVVQSLFLSRYPDEKIGKDAEARAAKLKDASGGMEALGRGAFEAQAGNADAARAYLEPLLSGDEDQVFFSNLLMGIGDVRAVEKEIAAGMELAPKKTEEPKAVEAGAADAGTADSGTEAAEKTEEAEATEEVAVADGPDAGSSADAGVAAVEEKKEAPKQPAFKDDPLLTRAVGALKAAGDANANSPLPSFWLGRVAELKGDTKGAEAAYSKAAKIGATHVASRLALGRSLFDRGELNDAIEYLEKVNTELAPNASVTERAASLHYAGLVHVARRQSDLAIENFTKALSIDPGRTETLRSLALEYEAAQKYKEALNFFKTNKNLGKKEPEVVLGIVRSHIGLEQWVEAISQLEGAEKLFPEDARFPFYLGKLNLERGDFLQARKGFERSVEISPSLLEAHTSLAQLSWRMDKDLQKGEEHISRVMEYPDKVTGNVSIEVAKYYHQSNRRGTAEMWYRSALKADPNSWPARLALSKLLLEEGKFEEATGFLERARAEGVQDVRLAAYLADAYRQSANFDRAIEEINKVIEQFPKNEDYVFIRGRIHFDRGNYDTAQKDFSRAYDLNPRYHDAYFYVGRTEFAQGDAESALKVFRHVLDYRPDHGDYRFYMARALETAGRTSQALDEYRKATAVDPGYGVKNPMVYIHRGRLLTKLGYAKEGKTDIRKALELAPENIEALLAMGESEYTDRKYKAAASHFAKALESEAEHPAAQFKLGMSLIYAEQKREGAKRLQTAIKFGYKDPEVYRTLGYLYKELGQQRLALESFQEYLKATKDKDIPVATRRELLRQIKELGG